MSRNTGRRAGADRLHAVIARLRTSAWILALAAGCAHGSGGSDRVAAGAAIREAGYDVPAQTEGRLALEPCSPDGAERDMLCGRLSVPEDHQQPGGRSISLNIVVVPAVTGASGRAALFELAGGPGLGVTGIAGFFRDAGRAYRASRDVVLVDQRGTGGSAPLRCPEIERRSPLEEMYPVEIVTACRRRLETEADLRQFSTVNSAHDLDRVRAALGYPVVDLEGISYGTELARAYMRLYPDRVRSAVLIGPPPADMRTPLPHAANAQRALDLLFHECQSDARCRSAYPELRANWNTVLRRLNEGVRLLRVDPASGARVEIVLTRGPFAEALRSLFTTATGRRSIPAIIARAASGDFSPFLDAIPAGAGAFSEGLYLSIACSEGTVRIDPADVHRFTAGTFLGDYRVRQQMRACSVWPIAPVPSDLHQPLATQHPVLVVTGEFDATTPPSYGQEVCAALDNCQFVEIPRMGHGPFDLGGWTEGQCLTRVILEFLRRGTAGGLDTACVRRMMPPPFMVDENKDPRRLTPGDARGHGSSDVRAFAGAANLSRDRRAFCGPGFALDRFQWSLRSSRGMTAPPRSPSCQSARKNVQRRYQASDGSMFWFTLNRLCGSYWAFTSASRAKFSPYVAWSRPSASSSIMKLT